MKPTLTVELRLRVEPLDEETFATEWSIGAGPWMPLGVAASTSEEDEDR